MDLLELRKEIDEIDDELIPLLLKRMSVSEKVAKYKVERGMPYLPLRWTLQELYSIK